jgi:hypothetical protein
VCASDTGSASFTHGCREWANTIPARGISPPSSENGVQLPAFYAAEHFFLEPSMCDHTFFIVSPDILLIILPSCYGLRGKKRTASTVGRKATVVLL